MELRQARV
jgi:AraC family transcriptional regulator